MPTLDEIIASMPSACPPPPPAPPPTICETDAWELTLQQTAPGATIHVRSSCGQSLSGEVLVPCLMVDAWNVEAGLSSEVVSIASSDGCQPVPEPNWVAGLLVGVAWLVMVGLIRWELGR